MTLARKLCGIIAVAGAAAPAGAQYATPRPTPQWPTRIVFPAPPWITTGPRTGLPSGATIVTVPARGPEVNEARPSSAAPQIPGVPASVPGLVIPAVPSASPAAPPVVPPGGLTPASAVTLRPAAATGRPDVWRPGTTTLPGTTVLAPPKAR